MVAAIHHPGEVLAEQLESLGISPTELARQLNVPANRITQIIHGQRGITGDSALRLAHWFRNEPEFWMSLQARHDLQVAEAGAGGAIKSLPTRSTAPRPQSSECRGVTPRRAYVLFPGDGVGGKRDNPKPNLFVRHPTAIGAAVGEPVQSVGAFPLTPEASGEQVGAIRDLLRAALEAVCTGSPYSEERAWFGPNP